MYRITTPVYHKAFLRYLRYGTRIEISLKASAEDHPTAYYIWRTRGDGKVRSAHAANNGKIFAWDEPPPTGNPGEDYNCRCTAEAYTSSIPPELLQRFRNMLLDYLAETHPWGNREMSLYFFLGNGQGVTLESLGHLEAIRSYYTEHYLPRFLAQLQAKAASAPAGRFEDDFEATYNFIDVLYSYRKSGIKGRFVGDITENPEGTRSLSGRMSFLFSDSFKDPVEIAQLAANLYNAVPFIDPIREIDLPEGLRNAADLWQKPYPITDEWETDYFEIIPFI